MNILFLPQNEQTKGAFDNNRILERKPLGFPQEMNKLEPYSTLFYWAYAWSELGGLIGEHPHRGFEIMTYVIEGEIEHYDNLNGWKTLTAGDAQVIRAGNGVVHAEKILPGGKLFQIWFDPNLARTLQQPASYNDYPVSLFPTIIDGEMTKTIIVGNNSPVEMESATVVIKVTMDAGTYSLEFGSENYLSIFVISGKIETESIVAQKGDFLRVDGNEALRLTADVATTLFMIESPKQVDYPLFASMARDGGR